jgi:hypothetical protein
MRHTRRQRNRVRFQSVAVMRMIARELVWFRLTLIVALLRDFGVVQQMPSVVN